LEIISMIRGGKRRAGVIGAAVVVGSDAIMCSAIVA
jgi:hypothetical protein